MASKKVAFVTGANRGLGLAIAQALGDKGFTVIIGCRNLDAGLKAVKNSDGKLADCIPLDINNELHHKATVGHLTTKYGRLDLLVNNIGVLIEGKIGENPVHTASTMPQDVFTETVATNAFAPSLLTQALLPLLRSTPEPLVIGISSSMGSLAASARAEVLEYPAYFASKAMLNACLIGLSKDPSNSTIKFACVDPGWVKTDMGTNAADRTPEEAAEDVVCVALSPPKQISFTCKGNPVLW